MAFANADVTRHRVPVPRTLESNWLPCMAAADIRTVCFACFLLFIFCSQFFFHQFSISFFLCHHLLSFYSSTFFFWLFIFLYIYLSFPLLLSVSQSLNINQKHDQRFGKTLLIESRDFRGNPISANYHDLHATWIPIKPIPFVWHRTHPDKQVYLRGAIT